MAPSHPLPSAGPAPESPTPYTADPRSALGLYRGWHVHLLRRARTGQALPDEALAVYRKQVYQGVVPVDVSRAGMAGFHPDGQTAIRAAQEVIQDRNALRLVRGAP